MKKIILLFIISICIFSCTKKPGSFSGNIYWKYNDYVGNKPDSGSEIKLYSKSDKEHIYETTADVMGNFKIEEIPPGEYFAIIQSKNTTDSPNDHLNNLILNAEELNYLFEYNVAINKKQADEIKNLEDKYIDVITDDDKKYGGLSNQIEKYTSIEKDIKEKSLMFISKLPSEFKDKLNLQTGYENSLHFLRLEIKEGKNTTKNIDFGATYN